MSIFIIVLLVFIVYVFTLNQKSKRLNKKLENGRKFLNINEVETRHNEYPILKKRGPKSPVKPVKLGYNEFKPKSGYHDVFFADALKKYFGTYIHTNVRLGKRYPDIAFIDERNNLYVDIEIDETYEIEYKSVTHYKGSDDNRDYYFVSNGWYVLRFSEEQVVKYTDSCCKYVAQFYASYGLNKKPLDLFLDVKDLDFIEQWDKEQGQEKAQTNFRENELGVKRQKNNSHYYNVMSQIKNKRDDIDDLPF